MRPSGGGKSSGGKSRSSNVGALDLGRELEEFRSRAFSLLSPGVFGLRDFFSLGGGESGGYRGGFSFGAGGSVEGILAIESGGYLGLGS